MCLGRDLHGRNDGVTVGKSSSLTAIKGRRSCVLEEKCKEEKMALL